MKSSSIKAPWEVANVHDYKHPTSGWRHHCGHQRPDCARRRERRTARPGLRPVKQGTQEDSINLGDVNYIDSSGLGHLVSAFTSVRKQEGELKLLNLTNKVHDVMQITRLYTVFDIMEDEAVAVKSFDQSAAASG